MIDAESRRALDDVKWLWRIVYAQAVLIGFLAAGWWGACD